MLSARGRWFLAAVCGLMTTVYAADITTAVDRFKSGNLDEAEADLRELAKENPNDELVNYYLGQVLLQKKDYGAATEALEKAVAAARFQLGIAHMYDDKLPEAVADFEAAMPSEQNNPDFFLHYGMTLLKQNKSDDAAQKLNKALELDANDAYAHYYLGLAENNLGRADLMLVHFRKFLELAPDTPEAARVRSLLRTR